MTTDTAEAPEATTPAKADPLGNMAEIFDKAMGGKTSAAKSEPIQPKQTAVAQPDAKEKAADKPASSASKSAVDSLLDPPSSKSVAEVNPLDEFKDDKAINFKRAREVMGDLHGKLTESKKEIAKLTELAKKAETSGELQMTLDAITKERDEMKAYVKAVDIKSDPDFIAKFEDGRKSLIEKAAKRLENAGGTGDDLRDALSLTGKKRVEAIKEALADADDTDRRRIESLLDQVEELDEERDTALKNTDKTWETIQSQRKTQTLAERQKAEQARAADFEAVAADLPKDFFMLRKADPTAADAEAWNADVAKSQEAVKYLMGADAPARDVAATLLKGMRATALQELFLSERKARLEAEAALARFDSAQPGVNGKTAPTHGEKKSWERPIGDVFHEALRGKNAD